MKKFYLAICFVFGINSLSAQSISREQQDQIDDCESEYGKLNAAITTAEGDYQTAILELRSGLFCSDCQRPKSEIERSEKKSFQEHIKEGGPKRTVITAPQSAYDKVDDKYKRLTDGYRAKLKSQKQKCEDMRGRFKADAQRKKEKEEQDKLNALKKAEQEALDKANKENDEKNKAIEDAKLKKDKQEEDARLAKQRQDELDAEHERARQAHIAELERQKQESIQELKSNISSSMSSLNAESRENTNRKVQALQRDQDWIERNNVGSNQQLRRQETAKVQAQNKLNEMADANGDMYSKIQERPSSNKSSNNSTYSSVATSAAEKYERAKEWLNDWRISVKDKCDGSCFEKVKSVANLTKKEIKSIITDAMQLSTFPISGPLNHKEVMEGTMDYLWNYIESGGKTEDPISGFKKLFAPSLPYGKTAERLNNWGVN